MPQRPGGVAGDMSVSRMLPSETWNYAPRYHSGGTVGLNADEVPAVLLRGERTDEQLLQEYREAHIFVLPSVPDEFGGHHTETQGVVIQEAQASGVIALASDTVGIPECVDDGRSAFLIPPRNPQALAEKIEWLLDHPSSWEALQRSGRAWVESRYAMDNIGRRLWETDSEVVTKHLRA